jgi:hypothetical protein
MRTLNTKFYVYEHWRPDTGVCFYVGKGQKRRAYDVRLGRNVWHRAITNKLKTMGLSFEVKFHLRDISEELAFSTEKERIAYWRSLGIQLVNLSDGGVGGAAGAKFSEEHRRKIGDAQRALWADPAYRERMTALLRAGYVRNDVPGKLSPILRGRKRTPEQIERIRAAQIGSKQSAITVDKRRISQRETYEKKKVLGTHKRGPQSPEWAARSREACRGRKASANEREMRSKIMLEVWARKKALEIRE